MPLVAHRRAVQTPVKVNVDGNEAVVVAHVVLVAAVVAVAVSSARELEALGRADLLHLVVGVGAIGLFLGQGVTRGLGFHVRFALDLLPTLAGLSGRSRLGLYRRLAHYPLWVILVGAVASIPSSLVLLFLDYPIVTMVFVRDRLAQAGLAAVLIIALALASEAVASITLAANTVGKGRLVVARNLIAFLSAPLAGVAMVTGVLSWVGDRYLSSARWLGELLMGDGSISWANTALSVSFLGVTGVTMALADRAAVWQR